MIVATMMDAQDTGVSIMEDIEKGVLRDSEDKKGGEAVRALLVSRGVKVVSFQDWKLIDQEEVIRGMSNGAPREKIVDPAEMLRVAKKT